MTREFLVLVLAATLSMAIMGWIIWSQRPVAVTTAADPLPTTVTETSQPPVVDVDETRVAELVAAAQADAGDVESRTALAELYFEAHAFEQAIPWFEQVLALAPDDVDSSTSLGVSYYYVGSVQRAVEQFGRSLEVMPDHPQTLLNLGIVRAFGLQDLDGAMEAWERILEVAPDGPEARAAREALDSLGAAHDTSEPGS